MRWLIPMAYLPARRDPRRDPRQLACWQAPVSPGRANAAGDRGYDANRIREVAPQERRDSCGSAPM